MLEHTNDTTVLEEISRRVGVDLLKSLHHAKSGHTSGSLSSVEILVALYFSHLRHDPKNPGWDGRDRFILSKGHGVPALYAVLAHAGYSPREELTTLRKPGSRLQGHLEFYVKIVATHAGVTVGEDGATHQALEDIALVRVLPNMTVIVPADAVETEKVIR